jgi:hypothetical protein
MRTAHGVLPILEERAEQSLDGSLHDAYTHFAALCSSIVLQPLHGRTAIWRGFSFFFFFFFFKEVNFQ